MFIHARCDDTLGPCTVDLLYILIFGHFCDSAQSTADSICSSWILFSKVLVYVKPQWIVWIVLDYSEDHLNIAQQVPAIAQS
jgi:hypothetical protein